jgi:taurine dioxygenase
MRPKLRIHNRISVQAEVMSEALTESAVLHESPFPLLHLSPAIGTEVHGINLANVDDEIIAWLSDLLVERKVLFFRDQVISVAQHVSFAKKFGDLEVHPFTENMSETPEVIQLHNDRDQPPYVNIWHSDVTWRQEPSLGSILRARVIPQVGGDTLFANMEAAYDSLDEETKDIIDGLYAIHDNEGFLNGMRERGASAAKIEDMRKQFPPARHPVVRTHPVSGRKSLYVNKAFTRSIEGMEESQSMALLQKLYLQAWIPDFQCRFRWQQDSLAFWDNRAAQHYAAADYWPEERTMERVTIIGDRPH